MRRMSIKVKELLEEKKRRKKFKFEKPSESKPSSSSSSSSKHTDWYDADSNSNSSNESWRGKNPCDMSSQEYSDYCQWCANRSGQYDYW